MAKTVRNITSTEVTTLGRNDTLLLAKDIMSLGRIRHFPVVEDDELVGVVSQRALYRASLGTVMQYGEKAQRASLESVVVKEIMADPISIVPDTPVRDAARLMMEHKIACLPVLEDSRLVGIVTETDMLQVVVDMA